MIFTTDQFIIRKLHLTDLTAFHEMQGNPAVMKYTTGKANTLEENKLDVEKVIKAYTEPHNQLWVWAIERQQDQAFVGTCALVDEGKEKYEIGYRFLEKYWGKGYGTEICNALIDYALAQTHITHLIAYVDKRNIGSVKILDQSKLKFVKEVQDPKMGSTDRFYELHID